MASLMGNKDVQDSVADNPKTIGQAMFKNLTQVQGYSVNPNGSLGPLIDKETKEIIRNKPTFGQYLKAFGAGYSERVAKDPEFASKMLAGFAAMMSPREGFAPLSPLGVPEFIGGYLSQEQAIQANKGATQKLLEAIQGDPELERIYLEGQKAGAIGSTLNQIQPDRLRRLYYDKLTGFADANNLDADEVEIGFNTASGFVPLKDPSDLAIYANSDPTILGSLVGRKKQD
tara:strand:- start:2325 stop:3014 length:690 start_codon:yes stop_codon:yes gene_type:complete